jgi:hypothetical protein
MKIEPTRTERCPNCAKKTLRSHRMTRASAAQFWVHQEGSCRDADCGYRGWRHVDDHRKVTFGWNHGNASCDCLASLSAR